MTVDRKEFINRSRRAFLLKSGMGLGALSAMELLGPGVTKALAAGPQAGGGILGSGHTQARAKRVICLHMLGAMSHVDTLEYKPKLFEMHGKEMPDSLLKTMRLSTMSDGQSSFPFVAPMVPFKQYGQSGAWLSDLLPHMGEVADDLCFVKSLFTTQVNHDPAQAFMYTGFQLAGRPSAGAWVSYALGSDNSNLPVFVVMMANSGGSGGGIPTTPMTWGAGFLPSQHEGVVMTSGEEPVHYLRNPEGISKAARRRQLDAIAGLSQTDYAASGDPDVLSRVSQYEMAYRMQDSLPEIADISDEPDYILDMYGPDVRTPNTFARNCLMSRRLIERGVKYVLSFSSGWDTHGGLVRQLPGLCKSIDQPSAALIKDLKQRGLLEDTLVMGGSEFGRTPFAQGTFKPDEYGRDHHGNTFTWWLAGGGTKAGHSFGETDEFACTITKDPVEVHDLNATMLNILGIDHKRLTFHFQGRDYRLTDVHGEVIQGILA